MPKVLKCAWAPSVTAARGDIEGLAAVLDQTHMIQPRAVADRNDQRVVDLIGLGALGGDIAFHQRRARGLAEPQQRAREHRRGRAPLAM